jgi:hypothetical protein
VILPDQRTNVWTLDLATREMVKHKTYILPFPAIIGRANVAPKFPNPTFDTSEFVLNPESGFWEVHRPLFKANRGLTLATTKFLADPITNDEVEPTNWVVLLYMGGTVGSLPEVGPACLEACMELFYAKLVAPNSKEEPSLLSGKRGELKARLQPTIEGIGLKRASGKLLSINEGANEYCGLKQGANFPVNLSETIAIVGGANYALACNAIHTTTSSVMVIPDKGISHPIIEPLQGLLGLGYVDKEEVPNLWERVEALPEDDPAILHLAHIRPNMTRISIRNLATLQAGQLRTNLLKFRAEVNYSVPGHSTLRGILLDPNSKKVDQMVSESITQSILWVVLTGENYPQHVLDISLTRNFDGATRWLQIYYYRTHNLLPEKANLMPTDLTFLKENSEQEMESRIGIMNRDIAVALAEKQAYTWGRVIACFNDLRIAHHSRRKAKPPECREIKVVRGNPQSCFASMNPVLYFDPAAPEFKENYNRINALRTSIPEARALSNQQATLLYLGFEHQRSGLRAYRQAKSKALKDEIPDAAE